MQRRIGSAWLLAAVLGACGVVAGGCSIIDRIERTLNPPPGIKALGDRKVVVLPFAPLSVRQVEPNLERELASALIVDMQQVFPDASFVPAEALHVWQAKNADWRGMLTPEIGKAFGADLVLEINVFRFRTRDRPGGMVQQGELGWEARVVKVDTGQRLWQMGQARVRWPDTPEHFINDISDDTVKANVIHRFVEKFVLYFVETFKG